MNRPVDPGLERVRRHLVEMGAEALTRFKGPYFERRLQSRLRVRGLADAGSYADLLDREPAERTRLLSALAIGVTGFFRNPTAWIRLAGLIEAPPAPQPFRAWSAGCATGEEAWSLALLLADAAAEGRLRAWRIEATDLDERSLVVARRGEYGGRVAAEISAVLGTVPGDVDGDRYRVPAELADRVRFRQADLTAPPPSIEFDLVLCRNVLMYFAEPAQAGVMESLLASLRVGGLLMLGKAELAAFDLLPRLEIADRRERIYRRVA